MSKLGWFMLSLNFWLLNPWSWRQSRITCSQRSYRLTTILRFSRSSWNISGALISTLIPLRNWCQSCSNSKVLVRMISSYNRWAYRPNKNQNHHPSSQVISKKNYCKKTIWGRRRWKRMTHSTPQPKYFTNLYGSRSCRNFTAEFTSNVRMCTSRLGPTQRRPINHYLGALI